MTDEDGNYDGNGEYEEENDGLTQELQDGRWRRYSAEDGGYYFHNFHTGESIWDPPDGWVDPPGRPTIQPDVDPEDEEPLPSLSNHPLSPPRPEPDSELGIPLTQEPLPSPFNHPLSPPRDSEFHTSNYNNNNGRVSPNVRASTTLEASSKLSLQEQDELRAGLEKQTGFQRSISSLRNLTRGASFTAHNTMTNLKRAHSNHTSNGYQHHKNEGSISENNSDTMRPSVEGSVDSIPLSGAGSNAPIHRQPTSSSSANSSTTSTSNQQKPPDLPKTSEKSSFTDSCTDCCDCSFFEVSEVPSGLLCCCLCVFVLIIVLVPVLTLESQPSCYPEEKSYFRKLYPALSITSVGPQLSPFLCAAGTGANYTLDQIVTGQGFLVLNGQSPSVSFGSLGTSPAYGFTGCQPIKLRKNQGQVCTGFNFSLPVNSSATDAVPSIVVTNPTDPKTHKAARVTTCSVTRQGWLMLVSKPSVLTLQPAIGCDNTSTRPKTTFTVTGQTAGVRSAVFLRVKTKNSTVWTYPTVTTNSGILGEDLSVADCSSYEMDWSEQAELCETLSFDLWSTNLPMKNFVKISNPRGGSACATDFEVGFLSLPPSKIDDATPKVLCWESGTQSVIFTGRFYSQDKKPPTLEFEGLIVEVTGVSNCTTTLATGITGGLVPNDAVTLEKCTTLTANITPDLSSPLRKAGGYIQPKAISTPFSSCGASNKPLVIISSQVSGFKQRSGLDQNDIYLFYGVQPGMFCPRQTGITTFLVGGSFASIGTNRAQFYIGTNQYTPASIDWQQLPTGPTSAVYLSSGLSVNVDVSSILNPNNPPRVAVKQIGQGCPLVTGFPLFASQYDLFASQKGAVYLDPASQTLDCKLASSESGQTITLRADSSKGAQFEFNNAAGSYSPSIYIRTATRRHGPFPVSSNDPLCVSSGPITGPIKTTCPTITVKINSIPNDASWSPSVELVLANGVSSGSNGDLCDVKFPPTINTVNCGSSA